MSSTIKGNKVKLATFLSWGASGVIGQKETVENGIVFVNFVWCKMCAKNKLCVLQHPAVKGASRKSAECFIDGTNFVTKHTVSIIKLIAVVPVTKVEEEQKEEQG